MHTSHRKHVLLCSLPSRTWRRSVCVLLSFFHLLPASSVNSFSCLISWAADDLSNNASHQSSPIPRTHSHDRVADQQAVLLAVSFVLCSLSGRRSNFECRRKSKSRSRGGGRFASLRFSAVINRSICRIAASNVEAAASCLSDQRLGIICSIFSSSENGMEDKSGFTSLAKKKKEESNPRKAHTSAITILSLSLLPLLIPASHPSVSVCRSRFSYTNVSSGAKDVGYELKSRSLKSEMTRK